MNNSHTRKTLSLLHENVMPQVRKTEWLKAGIVTPAKGQMFYAVPLPRTYLKAALTWLPCSAQAGIRIVQGLWWYRDVKVTMDCAQVLQQGPVGVLSPLDGM